MAVNAGFVVKLRVTLHEADGTEVQAIEAILNPTGADPDEDAPYYLAPEDHKTVSLEVARFVTSMAEDGLECGIVVAIEEKDE